MRIKDHEQIRVPIVDLKPHPRNYRGHPEDQIEHLKESIANHGFYRAIVTAKDLTILAGHGVVKAANELNLKTVPVVKLPIEADSPMALKVLAGDNEISKRGIVDDRLLTEMLREVAMVDNLLGTGYDEQQLAALAMVTRPASEIESFDAAAEWLGMPDFQGEAAPLKLIVSFESDHDKQDFAERLGIGITDKTKSIWWPPREQDDLASVRIVSDAAG